MLVLRVFAVALKSFCSFPGYSLVLLLLQSISCVQLFAAPWVIAYQAPLSMKFPRQEYWSGLPFPFLGDLPNPGIEPVSPALQADSLPLSQQGSPTPWCTLHGWDPQCHPQSSILLQAQSADNYIPCFTEKIETIQSELETPIFILKCIYIIMQFIKKKFLLFSRVILLPASLTTSYHLYNLVSPVILPRLQYLLAVCPPGRSHRLCLLFPAIKKTLQWL